MVSKNDTQGNDSGDSSNFVYSVNKGNGRDARFNPEGRKYQIKSIWDLHHEIMRLAVLGWKGTEIAQQLGCTPATVSNTLGSELVKRQLEVMRGARDADTIDILAEIKRMAPGALKRIESIIESTASDRNSLVAAIDIMDRAGYAAPKVIEGRFTNVHLTVEEIEDIKHRAQTARLIAHAEETVNG